MGQSFLSQLLLERDVATDHFMVTRHGKENGCWTLDGSLSGSGDTKKQLYFSFYDNFPML